MRLKTTINFENDAARVFDHVDVANITFENPDHILHLYSLNVNIYSYLNLIPKAHAAEKRITFERGTQNNCNKNLTKAVKRALDLRNYFGSGSSIEIQMSLVTGRSLAAVIEAVAAAVNLDQWPTRFRHIKVFRNNGDSFQEDEAQEFSINLQRLDVVEVHNTLDIDCAFRQG